MARGTMPAGLGSAGATMWLFKTPLILQIAVGKKGYVMMFCVPDAPDVKVITENGIARRVFIDGHELRRVTDVDISYGVNCLPSVKVMFNAKVEIEEEVVD